MIPEERESTTPVVSAFLPPDGQTETPIIDFERGGVNVFDPSAGLRVKPWEFYLRAATVYCKADDTAEYAIFSNSGITSLSGAWDQNMNPIVVYTVGAETRLNWYDTLAGTRRDDSFGTEIRSPRLSLDDKRSSQFGNSDIIFAYMKADKLCYRQQRDRYGVERVIREGLPTDCLLVSVGMNAGWRLQFKLMEF